MRKGVAEFDHYVWVLQRLACIRASYRRNIGDDHGARLDLVEDKLCQVRRARNALSIMIQMDILSLRNLELNILLKALDRGFQASTNKVPGDTPRAITLPGPEDLHEDSLCYLHYLAACSVAPAL